MDDNMEKNGLDPTPDEALPVDETENEASDSVGVEEKVIDFCTDSDEVTISAPDDGGIPITAEDSTDEEESGAEMCILCGENPADKSHGEDYDLCSDCRKRLINSPIRFSGILAFILVVFIGVWGFWFSAAQKTILQSSLDADNYFAQKKYYSAMGAYGSATDIGWKTAKKLTVAYRNSGYLSGINNAVQTYFYNKDTVEEGKTLTYADKVGKSNINAPWNKDIKAISDTYNAQMAAYQKYYSFYSDYVDKLYGQEIELKDVPYADIIAKLEAAKKTDTTTEGNAFISYCEYDLSTMCEKDLATQLKYLKAVEKAAPDYGWLYYTPICDVLIHMDDYDAALEYADKLQSNNAEDLYCEYYRAQILRRQGKNDEALAKLKPLVDDYESNGFYLAYYESAINSFIKKDYKQAREYLEVCYTDGAYRNTYSANFYALVCKLLKDETSYKSVAELFESQKLTMSPAIEQYISGKITAEQIFNGSEVEFE